LLIPILLLCIGLSGCPWPWPSITRNSEGLGKSEIARILQHACCAAYEKIIARKVSDALEAAREGQSARAAAEKIGLICDNPPSKTCRYNGEMKYQFHVEPNPENPDAHKIHIVSYKIILGNYDEPNNLIVEQKTSVLP
jgi:hypothetical protein